MREPTAPQRRVLERMATGQLVIQPSLLFDPLAGCYFLNPYQPVRSDLMRRLRDYGWVDYSGAWAMHGTYQITEAGKEAIKQ